MESVVLIIVLAMRVWAQQCSEKRYPRGWWSISCYFFVESGAQEGALKCSTSPVDSFFALIKKVIRKTLSTRLVEDLGRASGSYFRSCFHVVVSCLVLACLVLSCRVALLKDWPPCSSQHQIGMPCEVKQLEEICHKCPWGGIGEAI